MAPGAGARGGRDFGAGETHGQQLLAGDGISLGSARYQLSSGVDPRALVHVASGEDFAGRDRHGIHPSRSDDRAGSRRYRGAAQRTQDPGEGVLPGCGALVAQTRSEVLWVEVGRNDGLGAGALGTAGLGVALFDRVVLAPAQSW